MDKPETITAALEVVAEPTIAEQFATARTYLAAAGTMANGAAALMVLLGFELKRLKSLLGETRGRKNKPAHVRTITWEDTLQENLGISLDSGTRYIRLAEEAKVRLPDLQPMAEKLLATPIGALPQFEQQRMLEEISARIPQSSGRQLMLDWGISRPPKAKGGARPRGEPMTEAEAAESDRAMAELRWGERIAMCERETEERSFMHCLPETLERLSGALLDLQRIVSATAKAERRSAAS